MSSLAASRADNFYYPPEWEPSMGSISKFQGSKGKNQYEQHGIIRFELPFDGWCLNCNVHMSKGLRFNAKKVRSGEYFSTPIWKFSTKCYDCNQSFVIRTNPKENTYDFVEGLRRHEQEYNIGTEEGVIELVNDDKRFKLDSDPMFRLQHEQEDQKRNANIKVNLNCLQQLQECKQLRDYDMNAKLRKHLRSAKKRDHSFLEEGKRKGLSIPLLELSEKDSIDAEQVTFRMKQKDNASHFEKRKFLAVQNQSVLPQSTIDTGTLKPVTAMHHLIDTKPELIKLVLAPSNDSASVNSKHTGNIVHKKKMEDVCGRECKEKRPGDDVLLLLSEYR